MSTSGNGREKRDFIAGGDQRPGIAIRHVAGAEHARRQGLKTSGGGPAIDNAHLVVECEISLAPAVRFRKAREEFESD
jgi:hypothetical protein